ncbi:MAG: enoyl-CoA hydratase-related protein [Steroidobacteraceae bacterium]
MAKVDLSFDGPIARLTLNRPEVLNAMDTEACDQLLLAAKRIERTSSVRCVIFSGAGKSFMSGADLTAMGNQLEDPNVDLQHEFESSVVRKANEFLQVMERIPVPVIVSVRGAVSGGGLGFACCGDFLIASESAVFVAAHILVGLSPDGGVSWYLPRLLGARLAKDILMLGRKFSAQEAERIGLVKQVVPDAELESATNALAQTLLAMPAKALANIKLLVNQAAQHSFNDHLQLEARLLGEAAVTSDFREGVKAFKEKRRPQFNKGS